MKKKKIVVMGFMAGMPIAGVVWQHVHYIVGLQRLGHEVYYIEDQSHYPYNPVTFTLTDDYSFATKTLGKLARKFGFEGRWSFCARYLSDSPCVGLPKNKIVELYREADAILNVCGSHDFNDDLLASGRVIYVESDPGLEQIKVDKDESVTIDYLRKHRALFTFGENIGTNAFPVPLHGFTWKPTRQPVVTDFWRTDSPARRSAIFTSVANWSTEWDQRHRMARRELPLEQVARVPEVRGSACPFGRRV